MTLWTLGDTSTDLWLDAADSSTRTVITGLSNWTDRKANGLAVSQSTGGNQPAVISAGLNGLDLIRFNGSAHWLTGGDILDIGTGDVSVFCFGKVAVYNAVWSFISKSVYGVFTGGRWTLGCYFGNTGIEAYVDLSASGALGGDAPFTYSDTGYHLFEMALNRTAGSLKLYIDGTLKATGTFAPNTTYNQNSTVRLLVGAYNNAAGTGIQGYLNGDIGEIAVIKSAVSDALRYQIEGYCLWRWGKQANLPAGHLYLSAAPTVASTTLLSQTGAGGFVLGGSSPISKYAGYPTASQTGSGGFVLGGHSQNFFSKTSGVIVPPEYVQLDPKSINIDIWNRDSSYFREDLFPVLPAQTPQGGQITSTSIPLDVETWGGAGYIALDSGYLRDCLSLFMRFR